MSKIDRNQLTNRIRTVQEWILSDNSSKDMVKSGITLWKVSERQVRRYIAQAFVEFKEHDEHSKEIRKAFYMQRKMKLIREMDPVERKSAAGAAAINRILDSMAELEGVKVRRHEISGKDGEPIKTQTDIKSNVDYSQLPTEVLEQIVKARVKISN